MRVLYSVRVHGMLIMNEMLLFVFSPLSVVDGCEKLPTSPRVRETDPPGEHIS